MSLPFAQVLDTVERAVLRKIREHGPHGHLSTSTSNNLISYIKVGLGIAHIR